MHAPPLCQNEGTTGGVLATDEGNASFLVGRTGGKKGLCDCRRSVRMHASFAWAASGSHCPSLTASGSEERGSLVEQRKLKSSCERVRTDSRPWQRRTSIKAFRSELLSGVMFRIDASD